VVESRRRVRIRNSTGLHARPCHAVVTTALGFQSELRVRAAGREVDGKSILELMTLNAGPEAEVELVARGEDAEALVTRLEALFESGFGERS
jgi:phosphotransferase system HPr (HPr) family protein